MNLTCSFHSLILPSSLNDIDGAVSSPLGLLLAWQTKLIVNTCAVILLPLHPASLMHKNPQRRKIIYAGMRPIGHKDQLIDLNISCICRNILYFF